MRLLLFIFFFLNLFSATAQTAQITLKGTVSDSITQEALIGASVKITQNGVFVKGAITDIKGFYRVSLDPGIYDLEFLYTEYKSVSVKKIEIISGQTMQQHASLPLGQRLQQYEHYHCFPSPHLEKTPGNSGFTFTSEMMGHIY